ncbi:hypothetical protein WSM22_25670 [Cytophagales bacterium WSM2-2]|nr:hypothetical protein WSM22_25670 [Cytophagales bacterium WSM2-2]
MKNKNSVVLAVLASIAMLTGCQKDFLNIPPQASLVDATYYQNDDQVLAGTAALYSAAWKDYCDQANWKIGDVKAGLVFAPFAYADYRDFSTFNITGLSASNLFAYKSFYEVTGQANTVIHNLNRYVGSAVSPTIKNHAIAECRFMRATAYTYLVMNYGAVPIIDDNIKYLNNPALRRNTVETVWEFVKRDYLFAVKNLMDQAPKGQVGRLTHWAAEGMLARTYLTLAGLSGTLNQTYLDSAKYYADRVIRLSGRSLLANYADLFHYPYDNNNESLFELEWVYSSNSNYSYQYSNTMVSQITPDNSIAANGDGYGSGFGATSWMLSQYSGLVVGYANGASASPGFTADQRLQATFMLPGFTYPEIAVPSGSTFMSQQHVVLYSPKNTTTASPGDGQGYNMGFIKKYVIGNIPGQTNKQDYPNDTYMLRLAEMYLIYAEAAALSNGGSTLDAQALAYFNAVHTRAGLQPVSTALTWDVIFYERVKEFAMEGMVWYDLVRRHYYDPQHTYDILNSQDRGLFQVVPTPWPNPTGWSIYKTKWFTLPSQIDVVTANDGNFFMPIPQAELSQAPSLSQDPVPFTFN